MEHMEYGNEPRQLIKCSFLQNDKDQGKLYRNSRDVISLVVSPYLVLKLGLVFRDYTITNNRARLSVMSAGAV